MPSLVELSSLLLLSSVQVAFSAAEPVKFDFKRSIVDAATLQKRAGGSEVVTLKQDQYKIMYTWVNSLPLVLSPT